MRTKKIFALLIILVIFSVSALAALNVVRKGHYEKEGSYDICFDFNTLSQRFWCGYDDEWIDECPPHGETLVNTRCLLPGGEAGKCNTCNQKNYVPCDETDDGKDYYNRGKIYWSVQEFIIQDRCFGNKLAEYYCTGDAYSREAFECPYGCERGACLEEPVIDNPSTCTDTDDGKNFYVKGKLTWPAQNFVIEDRCSEGKLAEYVCTDDAYQRIYHSCSYGCSDGACLEEPQTSCVDTDEGDDYYEYGKVILYVSTGEKNISKDTCLPNGNLEEWICDKEGYNQPARIEHTCEAGCFEGECINANCFEVETCGNRIDDDCDGQIDEYDDCYGICDTDNDGFDGPWWCFGGGTNDDCDDNNAYVNPDMEEICDDGLDNDCDGLVDCADTECAGFVNTYNPEKSCSCLAGSLIPCGDDVGECNSGVKECYYSEDLGRHTWSECIQASTGGEEICDNAVDDDCDGVVDEDCTDPTDRCSPGTTRNCGPADATGEYLQIGACTAGVQYCIDEGVWSECDGAIYPEETETCNNAIDDDCDGLIDCHDTDCFEVDECIDTTQADNDADGYTVAGGDCDDNNKFVNPGVASDNCFNELDDNCDGIVNDECCDSDNECGQLEYCLNRNCAPNTGSLRLNCANDIECGNFFGFECKEMIDSTNPAYPTSICCPPTYCASSDGCFRGGTQLSNYICREGTWIDSSPICTSTTEVCDGVDNDCDDQVDEGVCDIPPPIGDEIMCGTNGVDNSCSPSTLSNLISQANEGDTIRIATGTHSWTSSVTVNKKVTITGGGSCPDCGIEDPSTTWNWPAQLNIGSNSAFIINVPSNGQLVRVTGLHINGPGQIHSYNDGTNSGTITFHTNNNAKYRIDNLRFESDGSNVVFFRSNGINAYGVIDHIYLRNTGTNYPRLIQNSGHGGDQGNTDWSRETDWNSDNFVFIEDSTVIFTRTANSLSGICIDQQGGGRAVLRHSFFQNCDFGNHGTESGWPARSGVAQAIYGNDVVWTDSGARYFASVFWRGGSLYVFDNKFTNFQAMVKMTAYRANSNSGGPNDPPGGTAPYDGAGPPIGYPLIDQQGMGKANGPNKETTQPQARNPGYFWNNAVVNTGGYGSPNCIFMGASNEICITTPEYIKDGREFYYCSDNSCKPAGYTPYTYPHPLTTI
ncbi:hypothetical protein GOV05_04595 [Candidatus Woesearchaeota archaeon]|nr:hypothetical protein [Candidatus Woesearchaeota archaeon]